MEGTVELIGLNDYVVGIRENIVGAVVLRDTSEEGITIQMTLVHDMGAHGRCGGLTMSSSHTQSFMSLCQGAQHLSTLLNFETILTEIPEFLMTVWYSRCVYNET